MGTWPAKRLPVYHHFAMIPHHLTAKTAGNLSAGRPRQVELAELNLYLVNSK